MMPTAVGSNALRNEDAEIVVVGDDLKPLIGRELFNALSISLTQILDPVEGSVINNITTQLPFKAGNANHFPQLISRIGRSTIHIKKSKFHKHFQPKTQKSRRVQINLHDGVNTEIRKLFEERRVEKLTNCLEQYFVSPIAITVKRDQTLKLALDSKTLNKSINKTSIKRRNTYKLYITNYYRLKHRTSRKTFILNKVIYVYSQVNLHPDTAKHFNIVSGDIRGTYGFITGVSRISDTAAEFQKSHELCTPWPQKHFLLPG